VSYIRPIGYLMFLSGLTKPTITMHASFDSLTKIVILFAIKDFTLLMQNFVKIRHCLPKL